MKKLFPILFAFIITSGFSQNLNTKRLDSLFQLLEKNNKYMGSIVISENGKLIYSKSIGYDDVEASKKSDINTRYRIGSISKIFTASLVLKAVEENKINLNQTIDHYFPTIKNANKITVSNLLNHRSGIYDFTNDDSYFDWNTQYQSRAKMTERIAAGEIAFEPDTKGEYSNSNYVLLTYILEDLYQKPYAEILNQKIVKPLKLKSTYYGGKINSANKECYSYSFSGEWVKSIETDMSIPLGAGGIVSTPTDLNFFIKNLFAGKIISKEHLNLMKTTKDKFGMGMFQFPYQDKKIYGHTGGVDRFKSVLAYLPKEKLAIAFCSNGKDYDNNNVLQCVLSAYFNDAFKMPMF